MTTLDRVAEQDAYLQGAIPDTYTCSQCGSHGCKLWRQYQTFADEVELMCVDCSLKDQNESAAVEEDGRRRDKYGMMTDQIGGLVPAVPTEDGETFWGYTSVPGKGVTWWKRLPLRIQRTR